MTTLIENGTTAADRLPHTLGPGGPEVSRLCLGTSSWSAARFGAGPVEALETVLDAGAGSPAVRPAAASASAAITFIDTSNEYGGGASESYLGDAIRRRGGLPPGMILQTKLDRDPNTGSFSGKRMRASLTESLGKLGLERVPMLYLHDPELIGWEEAFAVDGPVRALVEMRERGLVDAIGISGGPVPMLTRYVQTGLFSAVITHNRYTLVDRSAEPLINEAVTRGVGVINAAVFGGGALARWPDAARSYAYRPAPPATANAIAEMGLACQRAGVSLAAAALQFSTRDPRITSTIVGGNSIAQVHEAIAFDAEEIPAGLRAELDALAPGPAVWQDLPGSSWP